jgi:hypothetical protein
MATLHNPHNHEGYQEDPSITELLAACGTIAEKERVEARFYALIACISHLDGAYHNDRESPVDFSP